MEAIGATVAAALELVDGRRGELGSEVEPGEAAPGLVKPREPGEAALFVVSEGIGAQLTEGENALFSRVPLPTVLGRAPVPPTEPEPPRVCLMMGLDGGGMLLLGALWLCLLLLGLWPWLWL